MNAIKFLQLLFLSSLVGFFLLNPTTSNIVSHEIEVNYFFLNYVALCSSLCLVVAVIFKTGRIPLDKIVVLLLFYILILSVSTAANSPPANQDTGAQIIKILVITVFAYSAYVTGLTYSGLRSFETGISISIFAGLCISIAFLITDPYFFHLRVYGWSNYFIPFLAYYIAYIDSNSNKAIKIFSLITLVAIAILSGTRSIILCLALGFLLSPYIRLYGKALLISILTVTIATAAWVLQDTTATTYLLSRYSDFWFDNRSPIWRAAYDEVSNSNIFIGKGYYSFDLGSSAGAIISTPHNAFLYILLTTGLLGVLVAIALLFTVCKQQFRTNTALAVYLPIIALVSEIPLYPYTYTRLFEVALIYFVLGWSKHHKLKKK
jgi:O-antigen ligase